jgi:O-antigen ligase
MLNISYNLTIASLFVLAAGIFTSVSFSAVSHVLLFVPGIYFTLKYLKEKDFKLPVSAWAVMAIIISIILSVVFNTDILEKPAKNLFKFKYFILPLIGLFAYFYTLRDKLSQKQKKILVYTFITATTVASISGLIGYFSGFNPIKMKDACHATRACGLYGMYMTYGYGIAMFLTLLTGAILKRDKYFSYINKNFMIICWVINFAGLFLSYTRGGWIGFAVSVPFFFFKDHKKMFLIITATGALLAGGIFTGSQKVRDTFLKRGHSNMQRIAFYQSAFKGWQEKPVFGWGYKNFEGNTTKIKKKYNIAYPNHGGHAHNNFLEHLVSTGLIGALAFLAFCLLWLFETYKFSYIGFPFVINFLTSGLFQYTFGDGENMFLIMAVWAFTSIEMINKSKI